MLKHKREPSKLKTASDILTPAQSRAARALLDMNQETLSELSELSRLTINLFEAGKRMPAKEHLVAIRAALEVEGVMFIGENAHGHGVRFRHPNRERLSFIAPSERDEPDSI